MSATKRHCILVTSSLVILFGSACKSSLSLRTTTTSFIRAQGLSGSTDASILAVATAYSESNWSMILQREGVERAITPRQENQEVLRREEDEPDDEDEFPPSRRRRLFGLPIMRTVMSL